MIIGASDGALSAQIISIDNHEFSHILQLSGGGESQIFEQLSSAFGLDSSNPPDTKFKPAVAAQLMIDQWNDILNSESSVDKYYFGHPYSRWKTIGIVSQSDTITKLNSKIYIAQGGRNYQASPNGFAKLLTLLVINRKPFVAEYIECGDHFLACPSDRSQNRLQEVIDRAMEWFLIGKVRIREGIIINPPSFGTPESGR